MRVPFESKCLRRLACAPGQGMAGPQREEPVDLSTLAGALALDPVALVHGLQPVVQISASEKVVAQGGQE